MAIRISLGLFCLLFSIQDLLAATTMGQNLEPLGEWRSPFSISRQQESDLLKKYSHLDPQRMISPKLLTEAVGFFDLNQEKITNQSYLAIIDYSMTSMEPRLFIVNLKSGQVSAYLVSHGRGSDKEHDGIAERFSNTVDSHMTSLGFFLTMSEYIGSHGRSLKLTGLSHSNSLAEERYIVIHGAPYVQEGREVLGRSHGCPAVGKDKVNEVINRLRGGALIYSWAGSK